MEFQSGDVLKAAIGVLSAAWAGMTGWAKYSIRRLDRRMDTEAQVHRQEQNTLHKEIREGFKSVREDIKSVHDRLDRHIDRDSS